MYYNSAWFINTQHRWLCKFRKSTVDVALPFKEIDFSYTGLGTFLAKQYEHDSIIISFLPANDFNENDNNYTSRRVVGPFPPELVGDTISLYMKVMWEFDNTFIEKEGYMEKFIVE